MFIPWFALGLLGCDQHPGSPFSFSRPNNLGDTLIR
jgi:hypothetical protein